MSTPSPLEARLRILLADHARLKKGDDALRMRITELETALNDCEAQNQQLKHQIDDLDAERFTVKRLRDERKQMRKKLEVALTRLEHLEKELTHVEP